MNNPYTLFLSFLYIFFSLDSVLSNPHLSPKASPPINTITRGRTGFTPVHFDKPLDEVYKKKHDFQPNFKLHPGKTDVLGSENTADDGFAVFYPKQNTHEKVKTEEPKQQKKEENEELNKHLILGKIGSGMYMEASPSLELYPGSLSTLISSISNYFSKAYAHVIMKLHNFFDAIDENLKKSNGVPVLELGDILF